MTPLSLFLVRTVVMAIDNFNDSLCARIAAWCSFISNEAIQ